MTVTNEQLLEAFREFKEDVKADFKDIKEGYVRIEVFKLLARDVQQVKNALGRIAWMVISAFLGAIIAIVIHPEFLTNVQVNK